MGEHGLELVGSRDAAEIWLCLAKPDPHRSYQCGLWRGECSGDIKLCSCTMRSLTGMSCAHVAGSSLGLLLLCIHFPWVWCECIGCLRRAYSFGENGLVGSS
jgi:hypothetical protein